jgi:hypothetical protein
LQWPFAALHEQRRVRVQTSFVKGIRGHGGGRQFQGRVIAGMGAGLAYASKLREASARARFRAQRIWATSLLCQFQ